MNAPYDFEDLVDYLEGRMNESDRKAFELALQSDTGLARRLEALQSEVQVNRLLREEYVLERFAEWEKEGRDTRQPTSGIARKWIAHRGWLIPAGIAASLAGILFIGLILHWFDRPNPQPALTGAPPDLNRDTPLGPSPVVAQPGDFQPGDTDPSAGQTSGPQNLAGADAGYYAALADSAYVDEDFNQALMGEDQTSENTGGYAVAVRLYAAGKYRDALNLLENPQQNQLEEYLYLRGYTYYHLTQYDKAEADFRAFRNFPVSDRKLDAQWCEVFCMLKQLPASRDRLDRLLTELQSSPGPYSRRAADLQMALKRY